MQLYLDSADFQEIEEAFQLGFIQGLTTTPTFMHRHGISDIDGAIVKLSGMVPELHVEALGETHAEIVAEAQRILSLPLVREPVFKVPVSMEGLRACKQLVNAGHRVNVHLVYTLNQAYMAMAAGASYVCPLAGRLQDQGHDALALFEQCVQVVDKHGYPTRIMFSSVRYPEHVRRAVQLGAHVCTVPWSVMQRLCDNTLTTEGTHQFWEHTRLMTIKVKDVIRAHNPVCRLEDTVNQALVNMTRSRIGAVTLVDAQGRLAGIFTDGDIRRKLQASGPAILERCMADIDFSDQPVTVNADALVYEAVNLFNSHQIDNIVVLEDNVPAGILDIQDLVQLGLLG
ncbi:MAG: transaldolase family protein [Desulfobacterales bacterium]|nr:transaldolase family protein [Desulfobacterales bacterium]